MYEILLILCGLYLIYDRVYSFASIFGITPIDIWFEFNSIET